MSNNRRAVSVRFSAEESAQLLQLVKFWQQANGAWYFTEKDVLKLAFNQLAAATQQLIKKKEAAGDYDTKIIGSAGSSSIANTTESVIAASNSETADTSIRDEGNSNDASKVVSGT